MSLTASASLPAAILDTVLGRLAVLFLTGTGGDLAAAHEAARQMLAAYRPETENELRLAAEIISFSLHALEALGQAADPDMPLTRVLRLRGGAVSLSREAHKSQRKLDQLQTARRNSATAADAIREAAAPPQPQADTDAQPTAVAPTAAEPATAQPKIDKALDVIAETRQAMAAPPTYPGQSWTQALRQRERTRRLTEKLKQNHTGKAVAANAATTGALSA